jgi:hypothetical protein
VGHLLYNNEAIGPGAQTSRPDDAGPVRRLLGGMASPAASLCFRNTGVERPIPPKRQIEESPSHFSDDCGNKVGQGVGQGPSCGSYLIKVAAYAPAAKSYVRRTPVLPTGYITKRSRNPPRWPKK